MPLVLPSLWHLLLLCCCTSARAQPSESPAGLLPAWPPLYSVAIDNGSQGYYPAYHYESEDDIVSPKTNFLQWDPRCDDGLLYFLTPKGWSLPRPGPMILDHRGNLIWSQHFANKYGGQAYNLQVQQYQGQDYLTFWLGDDRIRGHGSGSYYMLNSSYDIVHRVSAANGLTADLHEFVITPEGTALMTIYEPIKYDLTNFPSYDPDQDDLKPIDVNVSYVWDCVFQEVKLDTGELLFEWRALEYININETYRKIGPGGTRIDPFDWYHINSIEKDELGNYLISARYTHAITYIDGRTGDIIWTLGGRRNDFLDRSGGMSINFAWQHNARFHPLDAFPNSYSPPKPRDGVVTKLVTVFDNAAEDLHYDFGLDHARGLLLEVTFPDPRVSQHPPGSARADLQLAWDDDFEDLDAMKIANINGTDPNYTVRLVRSYENPNTFRSSSQGSVQVLPGSKGEDSKVLVGYGLNAVWTEFDADGSVLCDVHYGANISWERGDVQSYRVYKFAWKGAPRTPPAVELSEDDSVAAVSWNGATEVAHWALQTLKYEGTANETWDDVVRVPRHNFETNLTIPSDTENRYFRIVALDKSGAALPNGTSELIDMFADYYYFPLWPNEANGFTVWQVILILLCNAGLVLALFAVYRRFVAPKTGRWQTPGWFKWWGQQRGYRLLNTA